MHTGTRLNHVEGIYYCAKRSKITSFGTHGVISIACGYVGPASSGSLQYRNS